VIDSLQQTWTSLLNLIDKFVSPDWGSLIGLLPLMLLVGVLGPLLSLAALVWFYYFVTKPRPKVQIEEGARPALIGDNGAPVFPPGLPYCQRHALVFPPGTNRCDIDQQDLSVICPMCGIGRDAQVNTCGNCGLVLKVERRLQVAGAAGPPPGGAAIA
jgi:hypothetical protein